MFQLLRYAWHSQHFCNTPRVGFNKLNTSGGDVGGALADQRLWSSWRDAKRRLKDGFPMATDGEHTFTFRVSGVELTPETKQLIASDITAAVTKNIVAANPDLADGESWGRCRINGGLIAVGPDASELTAVIGESPASSVLDFGA
jgi:hypothetical protein